MKIRGFLSFVCRDKVEAALKVNGLFIPVTKGGSIATGQLSSLAFLQTGGFLLNQQFL